MNRLRAAAKTVFFPLVSGTVLLFALFSCSDTQPRITSLVTTVVLDYPSWDSVPDMRLSVFAETTLDERAVQEIRAVHNESGLEWQCTSPRKISASKNTTWAGYTNFVPVQGSVIPQGSYTLYYEDMSGDECQSSFSISYSDRLPETSASELNSLRLDMEENIALYDAEGLLLYYGERRDGWNGSAGIKKDYGAAEKMRICYSLYGGRAVCMMPAENL